MSRRVVSNTATAVYRLYDSGGELLYVGITNNPVRRFSQHQSEQPWWGAVLRRSRRPACGPRRAVHRLLGRTGPNSFHAVPGSKARPARLALSRGGPCCVHFKELPRQSVQIHSRPGLSFTGT